MATAAIVIVTTTIALSILAAFEYRLIPFVRGTSHVTLSFSPNSLRNHEVILAVLAIIEKSVFQAITRVTTLSSKKPGQGLTLVSPFLLSREDVLRYHSAIGLNDTTATSIEPSHLSLFLSAVTEPAMLLLLTSRACPINSLGAVNVRNRFELLRPDLCTPSSFRAPNRATLFARVRNELRAVKRGVEYDLEVTITVSDHAGNGEAVPVFRQVFTMLEFRRTNSSKVERNAGGEKAPREKRQSLDPAIQMSLSSSDPLRWASLCKDYNLIHLSSVAARLFGLPGKLAHGNHVVARAVQKLLETNSIRPLGNAPMWMEVQFKRPVVVPANLNVEMASTSTATSGFVITHDGRVCVTAEYGLL